MEKFAFVIHPIDIRRDLARKGGIYAAASFLPEPAVEWFLQKKEPMVASHITGIKSITGAEAEGWFIGCPLTAHQLMTLPEDFVMQRLIQCGKIAEEQGAKVIGLGAFTSIVGDSGIKLAKHLNIAVTTGNSYTVATAVEGTLDAAARMGIDISRAKVAIVGASGSIGKTCALILAPKAQEIALIGRDLSRLKAVADELGDVRTSLHTEVHEGLKDADIVVTVTSAKDAVIEPGDLKSGCVVCDVARPRDVSVRVAKERKDVLVIEGGVVSVPGDVDFHFNFGFPEKTAYACMSETMMLALDGRYESFTLGKEVTIEQANETTRLAAKHGFKLAGYRSFETAVTDAHIESIRRNAKAHSKFVQAVEHPIPAEAVAAD